MSCIGVRAVTVPGLGVRLRIRPVNSGLLICNMCKAAGRVEAVKSSARCVLNLICTLYTVEFDFLGKWLSERGRGVTCIRETYAGGQH